MKEFFTILFFGKVVLLTPQPVTFEDHLEIVLNEPIAAVTRGASLQVEVTSMIEVTGVIETREAVDDRFPEDCVRAILHGSDSQVELWRMGTRVSNDRVQIGLYSDSGVPIDTEFSRIEVFSCAQMTDVDVYWSNHKN